MGAWVDTIFQAVWKFKDEGSSTSGVRASGPAAAAVPVNTWSRRSDNLG